MKRSPHHSGRARNIARDRSLKQKERKVAKQLKLQRETETQFFNRLAANSVIRGKLAVTDSKQREELLATITDADMKEQINSVLDEVAPKASKKALKKQREEIAALKPQLIAAKKKELEIAREIGRALEIFFTGGIDTGKGNPKRIKSLPYTPAIAAIQRRSVEREEAFLRRQTWPVPPQTIAPFTKPVIGSKRVSGMRGWTSECRGQFVTVSYPRKGTGEVSNARADRGRSFWKGDHPSHEESRRYLILEAVKVRNAVSALSRDVPVAWSVVQSVYSTSALKAISEAGVGVNYRFRSVLAPEELHKSNSTDTTDKRRKSEAAQRLLAIRQNRRKGDRGNSVRTESQTVANKQRFLDGIREERS